MSNNFHDGIEMGWLPGGKRLSMRHGPIDLIIEADGDRTQVEKAYQQAASAFETVLSELVSELEILRKPLGDRRQVLQGVIARNMQRAVRNIADDVFATPMIAVAGAVADRVLYAMKDNTQLERAYVNNGGDIALYLSSKATFDVGICSNIETGSLMSKAHICADDNIGGIATSGWRGRSHSFGIADAVTVLAVDGATADTAATLIANEIDLPDHPAISRTPAVELSPDSDLGYQLVTVAVGNLTVPETKAALCRGQEFASGMIERGDVQAVHASLNGRSFSLRSDSVGRGEEYIDRAAVSKEEMFYA